MSKEKYALGIDFGTESARTVLVDCADGRELATTVYHYANGVIDERLPPPNDDVELEPRLGAPGSGGLHPNVSGDSAPHCSPRPASIPPT